MQNMLLCVINVVNPKVYNPENQLHLFPVSELCRSPALHLKEGHDGWAGVRIWGSKQAGQFGKWMLPGLSSFSKPEETIRNFISPSIWAHVALLFMFLLFWPCS